MNSVAAAWKRLASRVFASQGPVWDGIYPHARDVPRQGKEFASSEWTRPLEAEVRGMLDAISSGRALPDPPADVAALAALVATRATPVPRVLDLGGGLATAYLWTKERLRRPVDWVVVETSAVCKAGHRLYSQDPRVAFVEDVAAAQGPFDVAHVRSALQYCPDWEATLRSIAALRAPIVALHKLSAGPIPTFATAQLNVPGTRIPYWFLAEDAVVAIMRETGYEVNSRAPGTRCPSMGNFPATHRLERAVDLVFRLPSLR